MSGDRPSISIRRVVKDALDEAAAREGVSVSHLVERTLAPVLGIDPATLTTTGRHERRRGERRAEAQAAPVERRSSTQRRRAPERARARAIPADELARSVGVGPETARDALHELHALGLVTTTMGGWVASTEEGEAESDLGREVLAKLRSKVNRAAEGRVAVAALDGVSGNGIARTEAALRSSSPPRGRREYPNPWYVHETTEGTP